MKYTLSTLSTLLLILVLASGCAQDQGVSSAALEQAAQDITGGMWRGSQDGDALILRPNGTGQSYLADTDITADITWSLAAEEGQTVLTWGFIETPPDESIKWAIEIEGQTMRVWPLRGSGEQRNPESDEPIVLERTY